MDKEEANAMKQRLDSLCLKQALDQFKTDNPTNEILASVLWQVPAREIPRIHGEDGTKALRFMQMMAYIGDDQVTGRDQYVKLELEKVFGILHSWGLLTAIKFQNLNSNLEDFQHLPFSFPLPQLHPRRIIHFHSPTLMQAIVEENKICCEENLLKELLKTIRPFYFSRDQFCSIWSHAYKHKNLLKNYSMNQIFRQSPLDAKEKELLANILEKYKYNQAEMYGEDHDNDKIIELKAFDMCVTLQSEDTPLELMWKKWMSCGYRTSFEKFLSTHTRQFSESMDTQRWCVYYMADIAIYMFALVKSPRPRPEYEEMFLKEAFGFAERLVQFFITIDQQYKVEYLVLTMLTHAEEPETIGRTLTFLRSLIFPLGNSQLNELEEEIINVYFNMADSVLDTDSFIRHSIFLELLEITGQMYRNMLQLVKDSGIQLWMKSIPQIVLNYIKCLEALERYDQVADIISESQVFQIRNQQTQAQLRLTQEQKEGVILLLVEIEATVARCQNKTTVQSPEYKS